jgi:TatD DNase family protein
MVDTHAHLSACEPSDGELVEVARSAGVRRLLTVGMDEQSNRSAITAAEAHHEVFASIGRHPNAAAGFDSEAAADLERLAAHPKVRAIGETGFDYYRDRAPREDQRVAFQAQIELARRTELPLVIHMRDSAEDTFATLAELGGDLTVILHCFSAPERTGEAAERGWYCSFAGNVTYPRATELRRAATSVPEELLLVETDSPFLAPQAFRGQPNQPANVVATAEAVAEVRGQSYQELERLVEANALRAFAW